MQILVTGGAGFIGSHLVDRLLDEGHRVTVLDDLSTGTVDNIAHHLGSDRFRLVVGSILDRATLEPLVQQADQIYHLAALVGVKRVVDDPLTGILTNVQGTENVLALAYKYWVPVLIASSSEVYGKSVDLPFREDGEIVLGPTTVPRWSYAHSKALDEHLALAYARKGLPVVIVRYFNAYGPRTDPRGYGSVVARFIAQALRGDPITVYDDGQQTRCFTYVADTVWGTILAAQTPKAQGQVFNIGRDQETSILELARLVRRMTGSTSEIVHIPYRDAYGPNFEESRRRVPDTRRAREVLGFQAGTSLEDGLKATIAWFQERG